MSTIKTKNVQVGTDGTASNNFTIYVPGTPDGTVRIGNGDAGAVTDAVTINSSGAVTLANNLTVTGTVTQTGGATFNGNVGIGTSSPQGALEIVGGAAVGSGFSQTRSGHPSYAITCGGTNTVFHSIKASGSSNWYNYFEAIDDGTDISALKFATGAGSERMRIDSSGNVLISTTSTLGPSKLNIAYSGSTHWGITIRETGSVSGASMLLFQNSSGSTIGNITNNSNTNIAYNTSSDYRLKENVAPMSGSIDRLKQLKPSTWSWVQDGSHGEGFIAHEAQAVVPESVTGIKDAMRTEEYEVTPAVLDDDGNVVTEAVMGTREVPDYQGIDQSKLVPLLTAALQEAITKIEDLETRIQALESNP